MSIDWWTLGLQTVNVVILIWLLGRFFWQPVAGMIEKRRDAAQHMLAEAEEKRGAAAAALAEAERMRAGFAQERDAMLAAAQQSAEQAHAARLAEAEREAQAMEAAAKAAIEKEKAATEKAWTERASRLAVAIAERLAARLEGPAVRTNFLDWLLQEIRALPEETRRASTADGATLDAVTALPLDPAEQARYRAMIGEALGASPPIAFKADPGLIAGLELHSPHFIVRNSWRADLGRILADITHDERH